MVVRSYRLGWSNPHKDVDALWILLPHDLAIAYEILGHLPKVKAASTPVRGRQACDALAVLADAEDEVEVTIEIATSHPGTHRSVVVIGSKKSAQLTDSYAPEIMLADGPPDADAKPVYARKAGEEMPLKRELKAFLGFLAGGPPPRSSGGGTAGGGADRRGAAAARDWGRVGAPTLERLSSARPAGWVRAYRAVSPPRLPGPIP